MNTTQFPSKKLYLVGRILGCTAVGLGAFCAGLLFFVFRYPCVDLSVLACQQKGKPSVLYDCYGREWGTFQLDRSEFVSLRQMPEHLIQAFIAAEDWAFFSHGGLSWRGIIRSIVVNLYHQKIVQGASTITQQLVKMLFYDNRRTFKRKIKEQFLTLVVEHQYTKEHILETYLNHVYFGCGMYGVQAAAKRFWGISVEQLSVEQSALLAAIICSPGHYSPLFFPYSALHRRNVVLHKMGTLRFLTPEQIAKAKAMPIGLQNYSLETKAPYAKEYIRTLLEEKLGKKLLYTGGLQIRTTLDKDIQDKAEKAFADGFKKMRAAYGADFNGALITLDRQTGSIRALIGGVSFSESQFNRALYARRQQGSVFKPVLYAVALEQGLSLLDTAVDEPLVIKQGNYIWEPRNHTRTFEGEMTLARALSYSNNIISAKIILHIGPQKVVEAAQRFHVADMLPAYPSLALGCLDSTVVQVAAMFNVFPNNGVYCEPHIITSVKDGTGAVLYSSQVVQERIISSRIASQIGQVLTTGLERRRASASCWIDSAAMSKTGTTNDSRVCWFAGATPELTTVVCVSCDDNRPMGKKVFPLHTAYPIWLALHSMVTTKQKEFVFDRSLHPVVVDWKTGKLATKNSPEKEVHTLLL